MRDGHALSETGPALQLSSLTANDSGNYTCALKTNVRTQSVPIRLQVEEGRFRFHSVTFSESFCFNLSASLRHSICTAGVTCEGGDEDDVQQGSSASCLVLLMEATGPGPRPER